MPGAIRLFRVFGIEVYLHFTWFLVAALEFTRFARRYEAPVWGLIEYLALFGIVLVHEFGHALACRQVGGRADRIMLWPLGGAAFVRPPSRPGAYLWSIAAGPLVNVILFPLLTLALYATGSAHLRLTNPDAATFVSSLWWINLSLLVFNLLPIYPLDGGQIVRGLLWYKLGEIRSLKIASVLGFVGALALAGLEIYGQSIWIGVIALFVFSQALNGWRAAQNLALQQEMLGQSQFRTVPPPIPEDRQS